MIQLVVPLAEELIEVSRSSLGWQYGSRRDSQAFRCGAGHELEDNPLFPPSGRRYMLRRHTARRGAGFF